VRRISVLLLEATLLLSVVVALVHLVRIALAFALPIQWYWGGAIATLSAPLLLSAALSLLARMPPRSDTTNAQA
jgi:hypothetical protein